MPRVFLTREAKKNLAGLPKEIQAAVAETIGAIGLDPKAAGKPLLGRLRGLWSARVGNYRVLYTVEGTGRAPRVIVRSVRHRAVAYRSRKGRT